MRHDDVRVQKMESEPALAEGGGLMRLAARVASSRPDLIGTRGGLLLEVEGLAQIGEMAERMVKPFRDSLAAEGRELPAIMQHMIDGSFMFDQYSDRWDSLIGAWVDGEFAIGEAVLIALLGGAVGCLMVLPVHGLVTSSTNWNSFSELAFSFSITPRLILYGMIFAGVMGLMGGYLPARRAAKAQVAEALRRQASSPRCHGYNRPSTPPGALSTRSGSRRLPWGGQPNSSDFLDIVEQFGSIA